MAYSLTMVAMFHALPKDSESMLYTLIGGLWGSVATIVTFKFGSSAHGQKQTDDLISKDKP
jgi:hypothetical protein